MFRVMTQRFSRAHIGSRRSYVGPNFGRTSMIASVVLFCATATFPQQLPTAIPQTKFASGQNIVPYFEGWIRNADGSFDMVFGYFNRNWEEDVFFPVGPDNRFEPGDADRGQPTRPSC